MAYFCFLFIVARPPGNATAASLHRHRQDRGNGAAADESGGSAKGLGTRVGSTSVGASWATGFPSDSFGADLDFLLASSNECMHLHEVSEDLGAVPDVPLGHHCYPGPSAPAPASISVPAPGSRGAEHVAAIRTSLRCVLEKDDLWISRCSPAVLGFLLVRDAARVTLMAGKYQERYSALEQAHAESASAHAASRSQ